MRIANNPGLAAHLRRRVVAVVPRALAVVTLVFLFLHLIPGDPVDVMLGETARAADKAALRQALGLDRPMIEQYAHYLGDLVSGELGESLAFHAPVSRLVASRYPATIELACAAVLVALLAALPLGALAAARPGTLVDRGSVLFALLGVSIPNFALGPLLILVFSIALGWLPVSGRGGLTHLILPALTLGLSMTGILTRMSRASLIDVLRKDYIRTAAAKGVPPHRVLLAHALRNALLPLLTIIGLQFGALLAGAIVTETIFAWPGLGRLTVEAIGARDYPLVQGCVLAIGLSYLCVNAATDMLYAIVDPRVRYDNEQV